LGTIEKFVALLYLLVTLIENLLHLLVLLVVSWTKLLFYLFVGLKMSFCRTKLDFVGIRVHYVELKVSNNIQNVGLNGIKIHFVGLNCTLFKENTPKKSFTVKSPKNASFSKIQ
jgi:hypothetical protein